MKKLKVSKSLMITGGAVTGFPYLNSKNHASKGIVADAPIHTDMAKIYSRKSSPKRSAIKAIQGK